MVIWSFYFVFENNSNFSLKGIILSQFCEKFLITKIRVKGKLPGILTGMIIIIKKLTLVFFILFHFYIQLLLQHNSLNHCTVLKYEGFGIEEGIYRVKKVLLIVLTNMKNKLIQLTFFRRLTIKNIITLPFLITRNQSLSPLHQPIVIHRFFHFFHVQILQFLSMEIKHFNSLL